MIVDFTFTLADSNKYCSKELQYWQREVASHRTRISTPPHTLQWAWRFPEIACFLGDPSPHLMHSFWAHPSPQPKRQLDRFIWFCRVHDCDLYKTDRCETDRPTDAHTQTHIPLYIFNNRPHLAHMLRCGWKLLCYVLTSIDNEPAAIAVDAVGLTVVTNRNFVIITSLPSRWYAKYCDQRVWMLVVSWAFVRKCLNFNRF